MTEKRFILKYLSYETCNGEIIEADPYYIDKGEEYVDEEDYYTVGGYPVMSDKQVVDLLNGLSEENEQLKQTYQTLKSRHSLLHDECLEAECDRDSLKKDVISLEKENEQLKKDRNEMFIRERDTKNELRDIKKENKQLKKENKELNDIIDTIEKDYENRYGMSIRNADWFTAW